MTPIDGTLCIARHTESEWNKLGMWTGTRDVHLTPYGKERASDMGLLIADIDIQQAFCSEQHRTRETLNEMLRAMGRIDVPVTHSPALNERDYGDYTGKNKWAMRDLVGEVEFDRMRREFDYPIPHGETLAMVYARAVPFYQEVIVPVLRDGKNVLVVSHGNTLRSLIKYIESISDEGIKDIEMLFETVYLYQVDRSGKLISREERFVGTGECCQ